MILVNYMKIYQATDYGIVMLEKLIIYYGNGKWSSFKGKVNGQSPDVISWIWLQGLYFFRNVRSIDKNLTSKVIKEQFNNSRKKFDWKRKMFLDPNKVFTICNNNAECGEVFSNWVQLLYLWLCVFTMSHTRFYSVWPNG